MKVSFIVPVYNIEKYIGECIESILRQSEKSFEIILVDDGSSDGSGKICEEYAKKYTNIKLIRQENHGVSIARNRGLDISEGEWVFFVDGDDTISYELLKVCQKYLVEECEVCFVKHKEVQSGSSLEENITSGTEAVYIEKADFKEFELAVFNRDYKGKYDYHNVKMATPCKFYRKMLLDKYKIKFPEGVVTGEDALFNLRVYKKAKKGVYIERELYYHRIWENSVSQGYDPNIESKFALLHEKLRAFIENEEVPERFESVYNERCIWSVGFCCVLNYCNPNNPNSYRVRKNEFHQVRNKYAREISNVKLSNFRFEKKILFWCLKNNWFWMINNLCLLKKNI